MSQARRWVRVVGRVVVVGSYNASLSVFGDELPERGQTVLGSRLDIGPGGKGNNQAIGAHRLGADTSFVVKIGRDYFGATARTILEREGLPAAWIRESQAPTGVALIMVDGKGDNLISVAPGANSELEPAEVIGLAGLFDGASHLLCQLECSLALFSGVAAWARARGLITILNPAPAQRLPAETCGLINVLTPNETELAVLAGAEITTDGDIVAVAKQLVGQGVGEVVVTLGARGAVWIGSGPTRWFEAYRVVAQDTTGAGDAFNAGLVAALAKGGDLPGAIDLGMRAGAFCATRHGVINGLATAAQLDLEVPARVSPVIRR
jgi:ribokinase